MQTVFDWVTIVTFGGLVVLFLQRSMAETPQDKIYLYLPPALGCAVGNYLGNHGQGNIAIAIIIAVVGYVIFILKPFDTR